jgi:hypothetical protein
MSISSLCTITGDTSSVPAGEGLGLADAEGAFWAKAMLRKSDIAIDAIRNFFIEMFFK